MWLPLARLTNDLLHFFANLGSPFHPHIVNLEKVRLIGGWEHLLDTDNRVSLCLGEERKLTFDISEAGPGKRKLVIAANHAND